MSNQIDNWDQLKPLQKLEVRNVIDGLIAKRISIKSCRQCVWRGNMPKRAKSAWQYFLQDKELRQEIAGDEKTFKTKTQAMARHWEGMNVIEKERFQVEATKDRERFNTAIEQMPPRARSRTRARTAYKMFLADPTKISMLSDEERKVLETKPEEEEDAAAISKRKRQVFSNHWNTMPDERKTKYKDMSTTEKDSYKNT
jgi:hypothetical protein